MTELNIVFANMFQGMIYAGKGLHNVDVFTGWHPFKHASALASLNPDICCLAEMVFDDMDGQSASVETFKTVLGLPHARCIPTEKSWVVEGKFYGLAIFSRFPFLDHNVEKLPNPNLTITKPNGDFWYTHDKVFQKAVLDVNGIAIQIINLHAFPFYAFNRRIDEPDFDAFRNHMAHRLIETDLPLIICGDFNNKDVAIDRAFPKLFEQKRLKNVVSVPSDILIKMNKTLQLDYILADQNFSILQTDSIYELSDHPVLTTRVSLLR